MTPGALQSPLSLGPPDPKSDALPLSYGGNGANRQKIDYLILHDGNCMHFSLTSNRKYYIVSNWVLITIQNPTPLDVQKLQVCHKYPI